MGISNDETLASGVPNPTGIMKTASAFYESCTLFAACDAGVFQALHSLKQADAKTISRHCSISEKGSRLLLNACAALGLIEKEGSQYRNTKESECFLVPGSFGDLTGAIKYNRDVYTAWGKLNEFVTTGRPVEKPSIHLGEDKDRTRNFVLSMHGRALGIGKALVPHLDFSGCKKILDVGGGPGTYSVLIARAWPDAECRVLDLAPVTAIADELIKEQRMSDRVRTMTGDFRTHDFGKDNDAILFLGVLHQESLSSIGALLKKAFTSLRPGGIVYIMDMMTDETYTRPAFSALFALNMALTAKDGWVFSETDLSVQLTEARFTNIDISPLPPPMPHWLARAVKRG